MNAHFAAFTLVIAIALAADIIPQSGPIQVYELQFGTNDIFVNATPYIEYANHVTVFKLSVPLAASSVSVEVVNNGECYNPYTMRIGTDRVPCSLLEFYEDSPSCVNTLSVQGNTGSLYPLNFRQDGYQFETDKDWYLSFQKGSPDYEYDKNCHYQLNLAYTYCNNVDEMAIGTAYQKFYCQKVVDYDSIGVPKILNGHTPGNLNWTIFRVPIPRGTAAVLVDFSFTGTEPQDFMIYGNDHAPGSDWDAICHSNGYQTGNRTMTCVDPQEGYFYVSIFTQTATWGGRFLLDVITCDSDEGGYMCQFPADPIDIKSTTDKQIHIPYGQVDFYRNTRTYAGWRYYYFDLLPNLDTGDFLVAVETTDTTTAMSFTRNAFAGRNSNGLIVGPSFQRKVFEINNFDFFLGGRFYLAFECMDSDGCDVSLTITQKDYPEPGTPSSGGDDYTVDDSSAFR
eukprot:TRINITY_DN12938_c0_g1_i1.p1 TRINITY_DN12938_c0_g1~~TRINITY_DN12938_c0_g1_i1.p1  ORF type:complete len:453 (+),score=42.57 TRINITY_DN12938_c0_g1_i1:235-1593(+)